MDDQMVTQESKVSPPSPSHSFSAQTMFPWARVFLQIPLLSHQLIHLDLEFLCHFQCVWKEGLPTQHQAIMRTSIRYSIIQHSSNTTWREHQIPPGKGSVLQAFLPFQMPVTSAGCYLCSMNRLQIRGFHNPFLGFDHFLELLTELTETSDLVDWWFTIK